MNARAYKRNWLRLRIGYERLGVRIFRKALRRSVLRTPLASLGKDSYKIALNFNIREQDVEEAYRLFYMAIGLRYGKRIRRQINRDIKNFEPDTFENSYAQFVRTWLIENGGSRIVSVRQGLIDYLVKFIAQGIEEGKTMPEIVRLLEKHILSRGFYRWQIERIVRTETTAAANFGATQAGSLSGIPLQKVWISSNDSRTRQIEKEDLFDHIDMDGVRVEQNEPFIVPGLLGDDLIDYPGDPKGRPGNVINCRCTVALVPKRGPDGRLMFL